MIRLPADGILYHGSYKEVAHIDLSLCRAGLDFGTGEAIRSLIFVRSDRYADIQ